MKGRKRKPEAQKAIVGTIRPDRSNPDAPTPELELPRAPDWLPKRACELFGILTTRLDMQQLASKSHTETLALWALRLYEVEVCTAVIEEKGQSYTTENGMQRPRPEVSQRDQAARHAQALATEFGQTMASVTKVSRLEGRNRDHEHAEAYFG